MKMLLLFSHPLSERQKSDAGRSFGIFDFVPLPAELQQLWSQVPAEEESLKPVMECFTQWLERESAAGDFVLIQGDFGLTFSMVDWCLDHDLIPVYPTTVRLARDEDQGGGLIKSIHYFHHVKFRRYRRYLRPAAMVE